MRSALSDMAILQQLNPNERCHYRFDSVLYYLARNLSHANAIAKDQSRPFGRRHFRRSQRDAAINCDIVKDEVPQKQDDRRISSKALGTMSIENNLCGRKPAAC
jgi:hypothetical protein